jgi:hypothetical protein
LPWQTCLCARWLQRSFSSSPATSEQWGKIDCHTIVYLAKCQKAFFPAWRQDPFVAQMYILLILRSQYFKPERPDVFGLDVSVGCGSVRAACIRHVNDPTGVWGHWKIAPNKTNRPPRAGGLCALPLLFFSCEAVASVRQTRPGEVPKGRPAASPASISGRLPSRQASLTRDGVWTGRASTGMA